MRGQKLGDTMPPSTGLDPINMSNTQTRRHFAILSYLPCEPRYITTTDIVLKLENEGFQVSQRKVQRDLEILSCYHSITIDDTVRPYRWSRKQGSQGWLDMTPATALTLCMAKQHLRALLPRQLQENLRDFFTQAEQRLTANPKLAQWPKRIASHSAGFQLIPPQVDNQVLERVEQALLEGKVLQVKYAPRPPRQAKSYLVNPLALVTKGSTLYLIATLVQDGEYRHFALHRASHAELTEKRSTEPAEFDLDDYLAKGNLAFPLHRQIELALRVDYIKGYHLQQSKLSEEQRIEPDGSHHFIIHANVNDNEELLWWLMSIADISEVLSPPELRARVVANLQQGLANYASG